MAPFCFGLCPLFRRGLAVKPRDEKRNQTAGGDEVLFVKEMGEIAGCRERAGGCFRCDDEQFDVRPAFVDVIGGMFGAKGEVAPTECVRSGRRTVPVGDDAGVAFGHDGRRRGSVTRSRSQ